MIQHHDTGMLWLEMVEQWETMNAPPVDMPNAYPSIISGKWFWRTEEV